MLFEWLKPIRFLLAYLALMRWGLPALGFRQVCRDRATSLSPTRRTETRWMGHIAQQHLQPDRASLPQRPFNCRLISHSEKLSPMGLDLHRRW
jgi:hypothetical protein